MAKLKPAESIRLRSGKEKGQVISVYSYGTVLKNLVQPTHTGTDPQNKKRFQTNTISQRWRELTPVQQLSYKNEAANYLKLNNFGELVPRSGYGLFLFLNQNLALLGDQAPNMAPPFNPITPPEAYITNRDSTVFEIKSDNVDPGYIYALFADVNINYGAMPSVKNEKLCGLIDAATLSSGIDVATLINDTYKNPVNLNRTAVRLSAIETITGNRDPGVHWLFILPTMTMVSAGNTRNDTRCFFTSPNGDSTLSVRTAQSIRTWDLVVPWHINSKTNTTDISQIPKNAHGIQFTNSGNTAIAAFYSGGQIELRKYHTLLPYKTISASLQQTLLLPISIENLQMFVDSSGIYIVIGNQDGIYSYKMSTPNDFTTLVLMNSTSLFTLNNETSFTLSDNGHYTYTYNNDLISQYTLPAPYDVSTIDTITPYIVNTHNQQNFYPPSPRLIQITPNGSHLILGAEGRGNYPNNIAFFELPSPNKIAPISP